MRHLNENEIKTLISAGNTATDWNAIFVEEPFIPDRIRGNQFLGLAPIVLGAMNEESLTRDGMTFPVGIRNSLIQNSVIGSDCAIIDVKYLNSYIIEDEVVLFDIHSISADDEEKTINIMNEAGVREILPFPGMNTAIAYLWAKFRGENTLLERLLEIARKEKSYGYKIAAHATINGATKIKNVNILSSAEEPTYIGENVILNNGVVGLGSQVLSAAQADGFVLGSNCHLKMGARVYDLVLGDNSTIACCEVGNSLVFPAHEQHHNNSFLIAACLCGQTNVAAGATLGSNHNSRSADGELLAGRGFWPGLCASVKHSSRFASFCLLAKGSYPSELNIKLPFSLVSNKESHLEIMPAYWWMYNMYALERNNTKFNKRDKRVRKLQNIEFSYLAPDSMNEVVEAIRDFEHWGEACDKRGAKILKAEEALEAYKEMVAHYAYYTGALVMGSGVAEGLREIPLEKWYNLGGQLVSATDLETFKADICSGDLDSWELVAERLDTLWAKYPRAKAEHALACVKAVFGTYELDELEVRTVAKIEERKRSSRDKDYVNPYRLATFDSEEEMKAVYELS